MKIGLSLLLFEKSQRALRTKYERTNQPTNKQTNIIGLYCFYVNIIGANLSSSVFSRCIETILPPDH